MPRISALSAGSAAAGDKIPATQAADGTTRYLLAGSIAMLASVLVSVTSNELSTASAQAASAIGSETSNRVSADNALSNAISVVSQQVSVVSQQVSVHSQQLSVHSQKLSVLEAISAKSAGGTSVKGLQSIVNALSNRISGVAGGSGSVTSDEASAISAQAASAINVVSNAVSVVSQAVSVISQQVSIISQKVSVLEAVSAKSTGGTSVKGLQSIVNALSNRLSIGAGISVTSNELSAASAQAASAINVVSNAASVISQAVSVISQLVSVHSQQLSVLEAVSVKSAGGTSVKGLQSILNALSNRISGVAAGSVTSNEVSAVSAQAASAINVVSNAVSVVSQQVSAISQQVSVISQQASVHSQAISAISQQVSVISQQVSVHSQKISILMTGRIIFNVGGFIAPDGSGSGNTPATPNLVVSSGTQTTNTPKVTVAEWLMDAAADEHIMVQFQMPGDYSSGGTLKGTLQVKTLQSGTNEVYLKAAIAAVTPGSERIDNKIFATPDVFLVQLANNEAAGTVVAFSMAPLTGLDSVAAGDLVVLFLGRDADNASDTATGDIGLLTMILEYVRG